MNINNHTCRAVSLEGIRSDDITGEEKSKKKRIEKNVWIDKSYRTREDHANHCIPRAICITGPEIGPNPDIVRGICGAVPTAGIYWFNC